MCIVGSTVLHGIGQIDQSFAFSKFFFRLILLHIHFPNQHNGIRYSSFMALSSVIKTTGESFEAKLSKDIYKLSLSNILDKSVKVAIGACAVIEELVQHQFIFKKNSDLESFKSSSIKALGSKSFVLRQGSAKCFASVLMQLDKISKLKSEETALSESKRTKEEPEDDEIEKPSGNASKRASMSHQGQSSKKFAYFGLSISESFDMLVGLYTRGGVTIYTRIGIVQVMANLISLFDEKALEGHYSSIARKLLVDMLCHPTLRTGTHRQLSARHHAFFLLHEVIAKGTLGEVGQVAVARILVTEFLATDNRVEPTVLATLECLDGLIESLGPAVSPVAEQIKQTVIGLLKDKSRMVRSSACLVMRRFCDTFPAYIIPVVSDALNRIHKELSVLAKNPSNSHHLIGDAYLAATLVGVAQKHPQYTSLDLTSRLLTVAIELLKGSGNVSVVSTQVQVGWLLISGLMALGPAFVKVHLSQLFLLWKTALHKATKDQIERGPLELNYLLHVRHYALTSVVSFLSHNGPLVTTDVARRVNLMLQNCFLLVSSLPSGPLSDKDSSAQLHDSSLTLDNYKVSVMKRVFEGYLYLHKCNRMSDIPAQLLTTALSIFASPDIYQDQKLSTSIATGSGAVDKLWELEDNLAFGLTSKIKPFYVEDDILLSKGSSDMHWLAERSWLDGLRQESTQPILGSPANDAESLLISAPDDLKGATNGKTYSLPQSAPPPTSLIDASLTLFVALLPLQTPKVQESVLDQIQSYAFTGGVANTVSRKQAIAVNSVVAIYETLQLVASSTSSTGHDTMKNPRVLKSIFAVLKQTLNLNDVCLRPIIGQSIGLLCSMGASSMAGEIIKYLIDEIVENRDPNVRATCALSLGYILKHVGGMFAELHMKTVLGILISLANDPHPTVHFWALDALSIVIENTGLSFASYATSTLLTIIKLYLSESHHDQMASAASSNLDTEHPTSRAIVRCLSAVVNVLGPDIQESQRNLKIILAVLDQLVESPQETVAVEAIRSSLELTIFAPTQVDVRRIIELLHKAIVEEHISAPLRQVAIEGLCQLLRTQSSILLSVVGAEFANDMWLAFDATPTDSSLRQFLESWLDDTGLERPYDWINQVQSVLWQAKSVFKGTLAAANNTSVANLQIRDEEGESFTAAEFDGDGQNSAASNEPLKWQTKALAVELLHRLLLMHFQRKSIRERQSSPLVRRVGDIIKIAFTASTSSVLQLRLLGLTLLNETLLDFGDIPDPDFEEVALLEQYQAQISSALTPAFSVDSSPELAFHAVKASAAFIGSGIVKKVDRMGRILKLLTNALESCAQGNASIVLGDLRIDSPNAQVMLRLAILSLWAELQVSSIANNQEYLLEVVKPHIPILIPLWIAALSDFARLRFEPESSVQTATNSATAVNSIDQLYTSFSRDSILPTYQESWLQLVDAVASLVEKDREQVFAILGERDKLASENEEGVIHYSSEPAAFFFVLFGLCFEALVRPQQSLGTTGQFKRLRVLIALKRILHRTVSGLAIYKDEIFAETVDVLERIVLNGDMNEQKAVVEIVYNLCIYHPANIESSAKSRGSSGRNSPDSSDNEISESVDQLFELFRIVTLALANFLPFLSDDPELNNITPASNQISEEAVQDFVRFALACLVSMAEVFPRIIKLDLYTCLLYIFERLLDESPTIAGNSLASQRLLIQGMVKAYPDDPEAVGGALCTAFSQNVALLKQSKGASITKRLNLILSASVLLGACKSILEPEATSVALFADLLVESISVPELALTVAGCIKQLIVVSGKSVIGKVLVENTLPFLVSLASSADRNSEFVILPKLINDILVAFTLSQETYEGSMLMLGISVPLLILFVEMKDLDLSVEKRKQYASYKLMELAGHNSEAFKAIIQNGLSPHQREVLEAVLRENQGAGDNEPERDSEIHIRLKAL